MVENSPVAVVALAVAIDAHGLGEGRAGQVVKGGSNSSAVVRDSLVALNIERAAVVDLGGVAEPDFAARPYRRAGIGQGAAVEGLGRRARERHGAACGERHCSG